MLTNKLYSLSLKEKQNCWELLKKLFPIYRTLLGEGYQKSLDIIGNIISLSNLKFSSGTQCGSWTIPNEWVINNAFIKNSKGEMILNYQENKFCIWQYSIPFSGKISKDQLLEHINIEKKGTKSISHSVAYYSNNWGFNISYDQFNNLRDKDYYVEVDTVFKKGELLIGEFYIPGKTDSEILIDSVLSFPSLANNLSGVAIAVKIADLISNIKDRKFSYRILFTPETIGPIALHYLCKDFGKKVVGAINLINLAYGNEFHYKKSRQGDTIVDKAIEHSLKHFGEEYFIRDFDVLSGTCGNEKAYNSLGINIPVGSFHRSPLGSYPEYDTDQDNINFINKNDMFKSLEVTWGLIQTLERCNIYKHTFEGEPFLTGYGLYPNIKNDNDRIPYDYLMGYTNGKMTLLDIAEKANIPITDFDDPLRLMLEKGLIKKL